MIHTETSKAKILLVEVPMDTEYFEFCPKDEEEGAILFCTHYYSLENGKSRSETREITNLPEGNWTLLNTLDAVTEDEAERVMDIHKSFDESKNYSCKYFHNDKYGEILTFTAKQCVHSLATSLGISEGKWVILYELI